LQGRSATKPKHEHPRQPRNSTDRKPANAKQKGNWMTCEQVAIAGGRIVPITGAPIDNGTVLVTNGKITAVGANVTIPAEARVIDVAGSWVLPGLVEAHGHIGAYEEAEGWAGDDTHETTEPVTAQVRALDAINPADSAFRDAIACGVLAVNVNPGSGNPVGGQTVAIKCWGRSVDEMILREPSGMKSALGENPKKTHGEQNRMPSSRLGVAAVIRAALVDAINYLHKVHVQELKPPREREHIDRDLKLEALGRVLLKEIPWRQHCHRADDVATALRIADEFGYNLVIDHGTEAHLLADVIAARDVPVVIGPLFVGKTKVELRNASLANPAKLAAAGVTIAITTDHPVVPIGLLINQASLAVKHGLAPETALHALTINPARIMGVADRLGSIETGKDADLVIWSGDPLDIMSRVERVFIDGSEVYTDSGGHARFADR
jgi:imidazolonepropionase-like amidohydrolase